MTLEEHGDRLNAAHARYLEIRRLLLIGRLDEAELNLADLNPSLFPPALKDCPRTCACWDRYAAPPNKEARDALARDCNGICWCCGFDGLPNASPDLGPVNTVTSNVRPEPVEGVAVAILWSAAPVVIAVDLIRTA